MKPAPKKAEPEVRNTYVRVVLKALDPARSNAALALGFSAT